MIHKISVTSTNLDDQTHNNWSLILTVYFLKFSLSRLDIFINFLYFRPVFFFVRRILTKKPLIQQMRLFLWYKSPPIEDQKCLGDNGLHPFSCKSCCSGNIEVFQHFLSPFSSEFAKVIAQMKVCWVLSNTFPELSKPFHH